MTGIFCMRNRMTGHQLAGKAVNGYRIAYLLLLPPLAFGGCRKRVNILGSL